MPEFLVDARVCTAVEVYEMAKERIGLIAATRWMFTACDALGGRSPVQAIKEREGELVLSYIKDIGGHDNV